MKSVAILVASILIICVIGTELNQNAVHAAATNPPISSTISFNGDWSTGLSSNGNPGANTWKYIQQFVPDRITRVSDIVRRFPYSARFELRPGDHAGTVGEDTQVTLMQDSNSNELYENESSGIQYYGISVRLDTSFPATTNVNSWMVVFELHGPDVYSTNPVFQLDAYNPTLKTQSWCVGLRSGDIESVPSVTNYPLSKATLNKGHWTDFILKIKYAKDNTGSIDIWRRDEGETVFVNVLSLSNIATLQYKPSVSQIPGGHYWRVGPYRNSDSTTAILWVDGVTRGSTYESILNTYQQVGLPSPTPTVKPGDLNGDNKVDISDFAIFVSNFGRTGSAGFIPSDIDKNGVVDIFDYNQLVDNYGK